MSQTRTQMSEMHYIISIRRFPRRGGGGRLAIEGQTRCLSNSSDSSSEPQSETQPWDVMRLVAQALARVLIQLNPSVGLDPNLLDLYAYSIWTPIRVGILYCTGVR